MILNDLEWPFNRGKYNMRCIAELLV